MNKTDNLYINIWVYFDESINGWYIKYGSYVVSVIFIENNSQLDITVKKYGYILGTEIVENDVTARYIENIIAKIICNENCDNKRIMHWANYTSARNHY